jgi:MATE family multidrug resistance protein
VTADRPNLRRLLLLAWPIVVSRSSQVVVGVADAMMVAHLGEAALAATTTGALNTFNVLILPMGIVFIVSSFTSQLMGRGDPAGARRYGWCGLGVAALAQLVCVSGIALVPAVLALVGYEEDVLRLMSGYLEVRLLAGGAAIGIEALANYYGGLGNTRLPMAVSLVAMALNVLGNWILIDGHLGAPALGVRGAAIASALSTGVAFGGFLCVFVLGLGTGRRPSGRAWPTAAQFWRMLRFGIPSGFNWFFEFLAFAFFVNLVVADLGTTTLAALMVILQINSVSFMPAFAVASAGAILVGQAIGAGKPDDVPRAVRYTMTVTGLWQGLVGVSYLLAPAWLMEAFVGGKNVTPEFLPIGVAMLRVSAAWQLFDAAATTFAEALRAAGETAFALWARLGLAWLLFAPGTYASVRWLGAGYRSATAWLVVYVALLAVVLVWRFRRGAWRRIDLTGDRGLAEAVSA